MSIPRSEDGTFPAFAWPGGYPLVYVTRDAEELCPPCANGDNGSIAHTGCVGHKRCAEDDDEWCIVGVDVHYEGPPILCVHCGKGIESAYGDPDDPSD